MISGLLITQYTEQESKFHTDFDQVRDVIKNSDPPESILL